MLATLGRLHVTTIFFLCLVIVGVGFGESKQHKFNAPTSHDSGIANNKRNTSSNVFVSPSKRGFYKKGAVASDAGVCSTVGKEIFAEKNGSAVDVAVATLLCQCVIHAHSCGLGGGFIMTVYNRENKTAYTIIAKEMAPGAASEDMFAGNISSREGGLAIGIPGQVKGLYTAWELGGKLPWSSLFEPSINLLRQGMKVSEALAIKIEHEAKNYTSYKNLQKLFTNPNTQQYYKEGEIMKRPLLARTYTTIANEGPDAFYNGSLTKDIVQDIQDADGIITEKDLNDFRVSIRQPITFKMKDNSTVISPPPPSSGAVYQMILNVLEEYGMGSDNTSTTEKAILTWHRIIETFKFAYAKRTYLGDGYGEDEEFRSTIHELLRNMTSKDFAAHVKSQIDDDQTHDAMYYGPTLYEEVTTGTSHLSVLAPNGDAVSVTSSINLPFGSKVVGTRTGIIFNSVMVDFATPKKEDYFFIPASVANFIKPYKRPLSSMCPSIIIDQNGVVRLVVGASGGTKITTATALVTIWSLWFGMDIKEAIDGYRLHHQLLPHKIFAEEGFPEDILEGLRNKRHNITTGIQTYAIVQAILQQHKWNITANCDFRKGGYPDGY